MLRNFALLVIVSVAGAQQDKSAPWVSKDLSTFKSKDLKMDAPIFKPVHIHVSHRNCKEAVDGVYAKTNGVYYACIGQEEVCNRSPHSIPKWMIDNFERGIREFREHVEASQAKTRREIEEARAKDEAVWGPRRAADARLRASRLEGSQRVGRNPIPLGEALTPAPQSEKVPDERVEEVVVGTLREELIRKFGPPHSRISGESERLTYLLTSGASVKFDLEMDKVTQIRVVGR